MSTKNAISPGDDGFAEAIRMQKGLRFDKMQDRPS